MISGEKLFKRKGAMQILNGISIAIERGKAHSIIGPSGGGKTTLLQALAMIDPPDAGVISIAGERYDFPAQQKVLDRSKLYPRVSMVFQGLFLFPHMSIRENLVLPLNELNRSQDAVQSLAKELHIDHILEKYPHTCSQGERQRAALARQVLLKPEYLLLDEVTSSLDVETIQIVETIIQRLIAEGCGVLMVTHSISLTKRIFDKFSFLEGGVIIEEGDTSILLDPQTKRLRQFVRYHD